MTIAPNSYGLADDVASLVPRWGNAVGTFDATTRPTLVTVERSINQISGLVNAILSQYGFSIPVTQADVKLTLDLFVDQEVAAIVEGINGSGKFGPTSKQGGGKGRFTVIQDDVQKFIETNAPGFERLGANRPYVPSSSILYRDTDLSGDDVPHLFPREGFGEAYHEWDNTE
jgi:hypothetical protein